MRNDCPACHTVYAVTPQDIGKRILCRPCGTALVIADDGFRLDLSAPVASKAKANRSDGPQDSDNAPRKPTAEGESTASEPSKPAGQKWEKAQDLYARYVDLPTILFGVGAFFILTFLFLPMIGRAKQERRIGALAEEKLDMDLEIRRLREKSGNEDKSKKIEEDWSKRLPILEAEIKYAEIANQRSGYFDKYGLLFGFVVLMAGSLGMVRADVHLVKRIFGATVLGLQMLMVFSSLIGGCRGLPGG